MNVVYDPSLSTEDCGLIISFTKEDPAKDILFKAKFRIHYMRGTDNPTLIQNSLKVGVLSEEGSSPIDNLVPGVNSLRIVVGYTHLDSPNTLNQPFPV